MRELSEQQQNFVYLYASMAHRRGGLVEAYRQAGYGQGSTPTNQAKGAWRLSHDERVMAAIAEETKKKFRVASFKAINAAENILDDPTHRDHGRAVGWWMERMLPVETNHNINVVHEKEDLDTEGVDLLRKYREKGWTRDAIIKVFGGNGLPRIEALLEAADANRRAMAAKVIEAEVLPDQSTAAPDDVPAYDLEMPDQPPAASSDEPAYDPEEEF